MKNTILATSTAGNDCYNESGDIIATNINNLIETNGPVGHRCGTPASSADPNLAPLADNGGPTQTMALLAGSPAIDAGENANCPATDQRGVVRPQGTQCDIGAYEIEATQTGPNFVVNTNTDTDDGYCDLPGQGLDNQDCTLREAINVANANRDASGITFAGDYTTTLNSALPQITTTMTIDGSGHLVTVSGADSYRVFDVATSGDLTLDNLMITNGSASFAGGILNTGTLTVNKSTFAQNSATDGSGDGGAILNDGTLSITNSTFSGNTSAGWGGAISNYDTITSITNSTLAGNSANTAGGGITNYSLISTISNTIIANNSGGNCDSVATIPTGTNNLTDSSGCSSWTDTSLVPATQLGLLGDNGDFTQTMALLAGSPAIDAGDDTTCPATDQRGITRPQGAACDIGAFELEAAGLIIEVSIDIKPSSETNPINIKGRGTTPGAILSSPDFDAPSIVDQTSLTFGATGDEASLAFCNSEAQDVNSDGLPDLVCHFYTQQTGFQINDTEGVLTGSIVDGTTLEGRDAVKILK